MTRSRSKRSRGSVKSEPSSSQLPRNPPVEKPVGWGQGNTTQARRRRRIRLAKGITEQAEPPLKRRRQQSNAIDATATQRQPLGELSSASNWQSKQSSHNGAAITRDKSQTGLIPASTRHPEESGDGGAARWRSQPPIDLSSTSYPELLSNPDGPVFQHQRRSFVHPTETRHDQTSQIIAAINALFYNRQGVAHGALKEGGIPDVNSQNDKPEVVDLTGDDDPLGRNDWDQVIGSQHSGESSDRGCKRKRSSSDTSRLASSFGQSNQQNPGIDIAAQMIERVPLPPRSSHLWATTTSKITERIFLGPVQQHTSATNSGTFGSTLGQPFHLPRNNSARSIVKFGQPQRPLPRFDRVAWVCQDPETLANREARPEKSLEDLYSEYPEKRLRSIEPETFRLVAKIVHQISNEAAGDWLKSSCPGTLWCDDLVNVEGLYDFDAPRLDYTIINRALAMQGMKRTITLLLISTRNMVRGSKAMTLSDLVRIIDQSIAVCQVAKDSKRHFLLQEAREKVSWLPVGLDCKKLDIQRRAIKNLDEYYGKASKVIVSGEEANATRTEDQIAILDRALVEFQEYRLEFVVGMFKTLRHLLEATA